MSSTFYSRRRDRQALGQCQRRPGRSGAGVLPEHRVAQAADAQLSNDLPIREAVAVAIVAKLVEITVADPAAAAPDTASES